MINSAKSNRVHGSRSDGVEVEIIESTVVALAMDEIRKDSR